MLVGDFASGYETTSHTAQFGNAVTVSVAYAHGEQDQTIRHWIAAVRPMMDQ